MANIALNKKLLENYRGQELITNGNITEYDGSNGFCEALFPCTFTIDLEKSESIECVRFLLWDKDPRIYSYRFLTSDNLQDWTVHCDTLNKGYKGWQCFTFEPKINFRYIRIHGVSNTANRSFHIVEVEAHDTKPDSIFIDQQNFNVISKDAIRESGDGMPVTESLLTSIAEIEKEISTKEALNQEYFRDSFNKIRTKLIRIGELERSIDSIRSEIVKPVKTEISRSNKIGNWSLIVGIIGGGLAVVSLAIYLFESFNK